MHSGIKELEAIFLLLLGFVVLFGNLAHRMKVAYPIVLVVAGLLLSFIPGLPKISLNPELFFLAVLPPLLFHAAWETSWREFRYNLVTILFMAFGLVGFTVLGLALAGERLFLFLDWKTGFLLGAIIAPTDAIAATAIARRVGLPQRITEILEGESLVNDATGLLALEFGLALVLSGETPSVGASALRLLYLVAGGVAIGLAVGWVVHWLERHIDDGPIELTMGLVTAYASYILAEQAHTSGVLAVVTCGFYLSRHSATFFSPAVRLQAYALWDTIDFVLNGLVFLLIGLQLPVVLGGLHQYSKLTLISYALTTSALVIALRLLWVYPSTYVAFLFRKIILKQNEELLPAKQIFVTGWTGMRGVLALAAALSIPTMLENGRPFPSRDLILFLTFSVILVTLVVQGLTLPALIRVLGLSGASQLDGEEESARQLMSNTALAYIDKRRQQDNPAFADIYDHLAVHHQDHLAPRLRGDKVDSEAARDRYRQLSLDLVQAQRKTILDLRSSGVIGDTLLRKLERELDLSEARMRAL
jgi:Na+/H+ antiporter